MINNRKQEIKLLPLFEDITEELSEYELTNLVPAFVKGFRSKRGPDNAITNKQIVTAMKAKGFKITDARVRKVINYIRRNDLIPGLIATSKGYYISDDPIEIGRYIKSLECRANEILRVRDSMSKHLSKVHLSKQSSFIWETESKQHSTTKTN